MTTTPFSRAIGALLLFLLPLAAAAQVTVGDLTTEHMSDPVGIGTAKPRFSWKIQSSKRDVRQLSYRIVVASSPEKLSRDEGDLWDSGDVGSADQLWITYLGAPLRSNQQAWWKVSVTTNKGKSAWSKVATFTVGLLNESKWQGQWIGLEKLQPDEQRGLHTRLAARYLRREFRLKGKVRRATAYVAGLGLHEFYVNGKRMGGNHVLQPVPTDYRKRIYYNTYDVTSALTFIHKDVKESNDGHHRLTADSLVTGDTAALGIVLGNGRFFPMRQEKAYKTPVFGLPKCRVNVIVEYENGDSETWATDARWKLSTDGPIRSNNEYDGEEYDARREFTNWTLPGFADDRWEKVQRCALPDGELTAQPTEGMVKEPYRRDVKVWRHGDGFIVDCGQNMAGWIAVRMSGKNGDTIRIKYAEKLDSAGNLYVANLRNARSEDVYVCRGGGKDGMWEPTFVYHGFRYAYVTGLRNAVPGDFQPYVVADEMRQTGTFETSDTILNKVWRNAWWGIRSNYKGMPVDCPQRNERQPWLGDRTAGCLGESFLFDNHNLYAKWMQDLSDGQRSDGALSNVTPSFWNYFDDNMTWPAVFPFATEMLYNQYGDERIIRRVYPSIRKWLCHMIDEYVVDDIMTKDKYGDWCVPPEKLELIHSQDPARQTDGKLIATAYSVRVLQTMEELADRIGNTADAAEWRRLRSRMTDAFNRKFLTVKRGTSPRPGHALYPDSVFYGNNTATANLLPLAFGIVPDSVRQDVVDNLVTNIITTGDGHVTCGLVGISWLMRVLSDNGRADVAWLLATNKTYPSWGYMAENGATTIWELWNGDKANPAMNSGNHVMLLGDLLTWCHAYIGGISSTDGYRHTTLAPHFEIPDCFSADVTYESPYGMIESRWKKDGSRLHWKVAVPANTTATVCLPDGTRKDIGSGSYTFDVNMPTGDEAVTTSEFLYDFATFPQAHAATITEQKNGDLVAAYFGGTRERNPDVCIWTSRKPKGSDCWEAPVLAADGVFDLSDADAALAGINDSTTEASRGPVLPYHKGMRMKRKACWNPVLYTMPDGEILLFYKIGSSVGDWTGWLVRSRDGGKTWSRREALPKGFIGPVKNKPVMVDGRLLCPSSTEGDGWKFHVEIFDTRTKQWKYVGPVKADSALRTQDEQMHPIDCIQPSILTLKDGRLMVLMRTRNAFLAKSYSSDGGETWSDVTLTDIPNNQSGTDAVTLKDGRHALIYNNFQTITGTKKGPRTPLSIALSDDGEHWHHALTLEDSPISQYSYPAIIQGRKGDLHCIYTWRRQRVRYEAIDINKLK